MSDNLRGERKAIGTGRSVRTIVTIDGAHRAARSETILVEAPLEIRWAGDTLATTMRTPGADHDLALGFLRCEGVIQSAVDVGTVAHCGRPGDEGYGNIIDITPGPGVAIDPEQRLRRGTLVSAACGVCGRQSIVDLLERETPVQSAITMPIETVLQAVANLPKHQPIYRATGATHGAALFALDGTRIASSEDIGRHNAVDKLVGQRVRGAFETEPALLVVSGRLSFEMIHKAAVLGVPIVASSSAASSLAIDLATEMGICSVGFAREDRANLYTHAERIR